jgi:hypothetical protein
MMAGSSTASVVAPPHWRTISTMISRFENVDGVEGAGASSSCRISSIRPTYFFMSKSRKSDCLILVVYRTTVFYNQLFIKNIFLSEEKALGWMQHPFAVIAEEHQGGK